MNLPMKSSRYPEPWDDLVRRARADAPPPLDTVALLRAVHQAAPEPQPDWFAAFAEFFGSRRALATCATLAAGFALVATWEAFDVWQTLSWAECLALGAGGVS